MPRIRLTVAYDGTAFHGWQKQEPPEMAPLRTVQGVLETAVRAVVREPVSVIGASRTDSGVHAVGQVAAFTIDTAIPLDRIAPAVNSRLPDDVQVRDPRVVPDPWSPITACVGKGYRYRLAHDCRRRSRPLFTRRTTAWTPYRLDPERMDAAARRLEGEHDFTSFTRLHHGREHAVRRIDRCRVHARSARRCVIDVSGNGFLYNMVRIIAGTLLDVGRGVIEPEAIPEIIAARDRRRAGATMPPEGLCLMWVGYGGENVGMSEGRNVGTS